MPRPWPTATTHPKPSSPWPCSPEADSISNFPAGNDPRKRQEIHEDLVAGQHIGANPHLFPLAVQRMNVPFVYVTLHPVGPAASIKLHVNTHMALIPDLTPAVRLLLIVCHIATERMQRRCRCPAATRELTSRTESWSRCGSCLLYTSPSP